MVPLTLVTLAFGYTARHKRRIGKKAFLLPWLQAATTLGGCGGLLIIAVLVNPRLGEAAWYGE